MPIATALIVAAAAYASGQASQKKDGADGNNNDGEGGNSNTSSSPPNITAKFLENKKSIELLPLEQSLTMLEWPIVTVSFYRCRASNEDDDDDADAMMNATIENLERRVRAVLRANPWLGGWLVRGRGIGSYDLDSTPRLWYDPRGVETAPGIFRRASHADVPLDEGTSYADYETVLRDVRAGNDDDGTGGGDATATATTTFCTVGTNPEIADRKEESLFRVAVVPSPDGAGLALVTSMSHLCGDGHTFHRILNMILSRDTPIASLDPKRPWTYDEKVMRKMGREESLYVRDVATDPGWMKLFRFGSGGSDDVASDAQEDDAGSELRGRVFSVDRRWIGDVKASHMVDGEVESPNASGVYASTMRSPMTPATLRELDGDRDDDAGPNPTQSTNDILVSFFWKLVNPDVGLMAVNFRGRLGGDDGPDGPCVGDDHAGNYANPIPYTRGDYASPALIRKSLYMCRRAGTIELGEHGFVSTTPLPRPSPDLTFSVVTNWSSFLRGGREGKEAESARGDDDADGSANWSEGLELVRHLPIVYPERMMTKMPKRMSYLVIFSSGAEDVGCVLIAPGRVMEEIDTCGVVKELIAEF